MEFCGFQTFSHGKPMVTHGSWCTKVLLKVNLPGRFSIWDFVISAICLSFTKTRWQWRWYIADKLLCTWLEWLPKVLQWFAANVYVINSLLWHAINKFWLRSDCWLTTDDGKTIILKLPWNLRLGWAKN